MGISICAGCQLSVRLFATELFGSPNTDRQALHNGVSYQNKEIEMDQLPMIRKGIQVAVRVEIRSTALVLSFRVQSQAQNQYCYDRT